MRILEQLKAISNLPLGSYDINVYIDGRSYNIVDTEDDVAEYSHCVQSSCGCCTEFQNETVTFSELDELTQVELLLAINNKS